MTRRSVAVFTVPLVLVLVVTIWLVGKRSPPPSTPTLPTLTVAIAPYQDLAMLVNADSVGIAAKHGLRVAFVTMPWERILESIGSAGRTVDVGFGSYVEYLTKYAKLNEGTADPIVYVQPLYVYKGGGFIAIDPNIPVFTAADLRSPEKLATLRGWRIGAQKQSLYDMMIYSIAARGGIEPSELHVLDTPMDDGLLALESHSLDLASAGLTQVTEIKKRGGRIVIPMEDAGFADVTGFICKKSTLDGRRRDIENLIRTWFDCVAYVMSDMRANSRHSLGYLQANAATRYTFEEYTSALSQEYLPRSLAELDSTILRPEAHYDFKRIGDNINNYLVLQGIIKTPAPIPAPVLTGTAQ